MNSDNKASTAQKATPFEQGAKAAAWLRAKTNTLNDTERGVLMDRGMQLIYGGNGHKVAAARR